MVFWCPTNVGGSSLVHEEGYSYVFEKEEWSSLLGHDEASVNHDGAKENARVALELL
jgi:hypothetical protein